jgi:exportin-T
MELQLAWIDISLIVNERFVSLIYSYLLTTSIRNAAADCLTDTIKKGMKPFDKLQLISILGIVDVLQQVDLSVCLARVMLPCDRNVFMPR